MKKLWLSIFSLILFSNMSLFAQPMQDNMPMGPQQGGIKMHLKLTPEQEKKFDDILYQQKQEAVDIHAKMQKNHLELKKMIDDKKIDEKKLFQLTDENSKLQVNLKSTAVKNWYDVYKMLNDDQKEIWSKHFLQMGNHQQMRERAMGRMQGRMQGKMQGRMNNSMMN